MEKWQDPETIILWLAVSLLLAIGLSSSVIIFTRLYFGRIIKARHDLTQARLHHQKALTRISVDILERERNRVAIELHDAVIHKLNTVVMLMSQPHGELEVKNRVAECIEFTRNLSHDLKPPFIKELALDELLRGLLQNLSALYQTRYILLAHERLPMAENCKLHLLRVVQEVINNVIKHASATEIMVYLRSTRRFTAIKIHDNGCGFPKDRSRGLGMQNIELRLQMVNGIHKFKSGTDGTTFIAYIPLL